MKILKNIFIVLIVLIAIFLIVALFLPSSVRVQRSIEVNNSANVVYNYVADFNNFNKWSPWHEIEPTAQTSVEGTSGTVGHKYSWKGTETGEGSFTITELILDKAVKSQLDFIKPWEAVAKNDWIFESTGSATKVTWYYEGPADYPIGRYFGLMTDDMIGPQYESGLTKLKANVEAIVDTSVVEETEQVEQ